MGRSSRTCSSTVVNRCSPMLLLAALLLVLVSPPCAAETRSVFQVATGNSTQQGLTACPISADNVLLNLTEVKSECVLSAANSTSFCDACSCALFSAFTPALETTGFINTSSPSAINQGVKVVGSCVNSFVAQFIAADVDMQALVALSGCQYSEDQVPGCLQQRISILLAKIRAAEGTTGGSPPTLLVLPPSPAPPVMATSGSPPPPGDYAPDVEEASEIINAIHNSTSTAISPAPATGDGGNGTSTGVPVAAGLPPPDRMASVIISEPGGMPLVGPGSTSSSPGMGASSMSSRPSAACVSRPAAGSALVSLAAAAVLLLAVV